MNPTVKPPGGWEPAEDRRLLFCVRTNRSLAETARDLNRLEMSVRTRAIILKSPFPEKAQ